MKMRSFDKLRMTGRNDQNDKLIEYLIFKQWNIF